MPIIKINCHKETYKIRAIKEDDIHYALSGRKEREATVAINQKIVSLLNLNSECLVLDIGCGDISLLNLITNENEGGIIIKHGFGILPTKEEVERAISSIAINKNITIKKSESIYLDFEDNFFDRIVCNGVFIILNSKDDIIKTLSEIYRVSKKGSLVYIGEILQNDTNSIHGKKLSTFLFSNLLNLNFKKIISTLKVILKSRFGKNNLIIIPKIQIIKNYEFISISKNIGFEIIHFSKSLLYENGVIKNSNDRVDYVLRKV